MIEKKLPDVQSLKDARGVPLYRVGVENVNFPILIGRKERRYQITQAIISMYGDLKKDIRGTNMSRFMEVLMQYRYKRMNSKKLKVFLKELKKKLKTKDVYAAINFKYFIPKESPVKKIKGIQGYDCVFVGRLTSDNYDFYFEVSVPITTLCPCSKEISKYGAHNQRAIITARLKFSEKPLWIEDVVSLLDSMGSCDIYPVLKRPDEKFVTETAFKNPKFVEDVVRDTALALDKISCVEGYSIKVTSFESIHAHNAVAYFKRNWDF
ncbi:MAG: GTP cyclohydrolase I FolE2 [Candidatus Cloacimonetes bacterium]|nr:GTP cyclohydrolase I FolE2 [Candidatus Cloacimonadota bacterium]